MRTEWFGKYRASVVDINDPERRGRIRVQCPKVLGDYISAWCEPCIPYATDFAGDFYVPPVNEAIWVEFEEGDPNKPIWNGGWYRSNSTPLLPENTQDEYRYISFKKSILRIGTEEFAFELRGDENSKVIRINEETWVGLYYISTKTEDELVDLQSLIKNKEYILVTFPNEVKDQFQNVNASLTYLDSQFNDFVTGTYSPFAEEVSEQLSIIAEALESLSTKIEEIDNNIRSLQSQIDDSGLSGLGEIEEHVALIKQAIDIDAQVFNDTIGSLWDENVTPGVINEFTFVNMVKPSY